MTQIFTPTVELDGAEVRRIRESKRLTQLYVAKFVGVTTDTISRWENNRYPSIKRENLMGLADALEVLPETLVHKENIESPAQSPTDIPEHSVERSKKKLPLWVLPLFFVFVFVLYLFFYEPALSPSSAISAHRTLPVYAAPGSVIPVRIELAVDTPTGGFVVREHFPVGWKLIEASPPASSLDNIEGMARWIVKAAEAPPVISYLIKVADDARQGSQGTFQGDVVLRKDMDKTAKVITGIYETYVEPFHWADVDGNSVIDDSEVLDAFDDIEIMKDVHLDWKNLSALWDEGKYYWDPEQGQFVTARSQSDQLQ